MEELDSLRGRINEINGELTRMLAERLRVAEKIADCKRESGRPVFDRPREREVLAAARAAAPDELAPMIAGSYDAVMAMSCLLQYIRHADMESPLGRTLRRAACPQIPEGSPRIGVQGIAGCNAHAAAGRLFPGIVPEFFSTWAELFDEVEAGRLDFGVLPIENSQAGSVNAVYTLLGEHALCINAAVTLPIDHCLLVPRGGETAPVLRVRSHPQALEQCRAYLDRLGAERLYSANTALAARQTADSPVGEAAIAPLACAGIYGLSVRDEHIQTGEDNRTRFIAVGRAPSAALPAAAAGEERISLRFGLEHSGGSLSRVLLYFSALGLNLTKLESRAAAPGEFDFYLDFAGGLAADEERVARFLTAVSGVLPRFRFLGAYRELV